MDDFRISFRRWLAAALRRCADRLAPEPVTELGDSIVMLSIEQRQAMRQAMKKAIRDNLIGPSDDGEDENVSRMSGVFHDLR